MYKLTYKGQFVDGFDADQVVGNLAQLLNLKPKAVRLAFLSDRPSVIKMLDSATEVERWCAAFQEAGVFLDVVGVESPDSGNLADQIELELELHALDQDGDEEPDERRYLIRKVHNPDSQREPQTFANQPLATRSLNNYPIDALPNNFPSSDVPPAGEQQSPANNNTRGQAVQTKKTSNRNDVNGAHPNGKNTLKNGSASNGNHQSVVATVDPIAVAPVASSLVTPVAKNQPKPAVALTKEIPETAIQELSVAKIDALAAQQYQNSLVEESAPEKTTAMPIQRASAGHESEPPATLTEPAPAELLLDDSPALQDELQVARQREEFFEDNIADDDISLAEDELALRDAQRDEELDEHVYEDVNFHKSHFVWGMLVILLAIIATAGTILWLKRSTWTPVTVAPQEQKITEAIASSSLFGLIHADLDRLQLLSPATNVFAQLVEPKAGFWSGLVSAGIDINQQVDDLWVGVYGQNNQSKVLWVLQGNFAATTWSDWLRKSYIIDSDSPEGVIFSSIDEFSCEKSPVISASISNNQIVLGAPELVAAFNGRLQAGAAPEKNLGTWTKGYNTQMISAALFHPGQLPEGSAAMALGKLSLAAESIQGIYLGLEPKMFPPVVNFDAIIASENQQFITDASAKLAAATNAAKTTIAADWPETLPLYERIRFTEEPNQLRASLSLDSQAPQHIQLWFSSLLSRAFGLTSPPATITDEQLEANPAAFANLPSAELPAFASVKHFNETFIAQTSSGPFGIGVRSVEQTDQGVEINLDVNAFNLPNIGKESDNVSLRITDVVDHQDKSLVADSMSGCGGIKQPAKVNLAYQGNVIDNGQLIGFTGLQGTKKIILPAGISLATVGAIKGVIGQQLPLEIERVNLNGPLAGKTLDLHGVQLRFLSAEPNRLYFQAKGNTAALLQVNALNEDGKVLASINAMRSDNIFDAGKTVSIDYQGKIAAAEIILASKLEQKSYEFSVARLFPPAKPFVVEKNEQGHLGSNSLPALDKETPPNDVVYPFQSPRQTIAAGPALIALNELTISGQQFSLVADVYTRNSHPLAGQLGAVRMELSEVEDSAGNLHSINHQAPVAMEYMGGSWVNGKFEPDPGRPWLRGPLEMRERTLEQTDVVALWGKLVFSAAEDPISIKVPFQFGMQWNNTDSVFKLRRWEAGRLVFDVEGSLSGLMAVKALDDMGVVVSQPAELRSNFGKYTLELDVKQIPETIEFNLARTQNTKEYPVEIRVLQ